MQNLDIGRAFVFGFEDPDWIGKLLIGALIVLVSIAFAPFLIGIIPGLMLGGYMIAIARNVISGEELPLPNWENFGQLLSDGFRVFLASFVWSLPLLLSLLPLLVALIVTGNNEISPFVLVIMLTCGLSSVVYGLFFWLIMPIIYVQVVLDDTLGSGLNVAQMWAFLRTYPAEVFIVAIILTVADVLAALVGTLLCLVGLLVTSVWYLWVAGHLVGQLARLQSSPADQTVPPASGTEEDA